MFILPNNKDIDWFQRSMDNSMKTCFVLWSAGVDSTYLIVRLLEAGYQVRAGYIEIENNKRKTQMEQAAIKRLVPMLEERFSNFVFEGTVYRAFNNSNGRGGLRFRQVPYFIHALLAAPRTDFRALGYVSGDSAIKKIKDIIYIYNSYAAIYNGKIPKLVFPLKKIAKPHILGYMNYHYPNILDMCVWCEAPVGDAFKPCDHCTPCVRRLNEEKKLHQACA